LSSDAPQVRGYRITQAVFRAKKRAAQNAMLPLNAPKDLHGDFECSESTLLGCATDIKPEEQRR